MIVYTTVKQGHIKPSWMDEMVVNQIEFVSKILGLPPHVWMPTTVGRTAARALECQLGANASNYFLKKLYDNIKAGDTSVANMEKWEPSTWPSQAKGVGVSEAPRGALGHWSVIKDAKIENYQAVVPTTWNASPRDEKGQQGAYEKAMQDTIVLIAKEPIEILRTIHSFDPCLACATHVYNTEGEEVASFKIGGVCYV